MLKEFARMLHVNCSSLVQHQKSVHRTCRVNWYCNHVFALAYDAHYDELSIAASIMNSKQSWRVTERTLAVLDLA